ncbi:MAG: GAF domain-containing protein, partial [Myxococcota bacterium]
MSIRAKILSILICALIMTFVVSALASYHASELDSQIGRMLTRNYPIARSAHIIAQSLVVLGQDERQLLDTGDPVYRTHVDNTFLELDRQMQIGRLPITNSKQAVRWSELSQILNELRQRESELADIVRVEVRLLDGRHRQVHQKSKRMRQELRQLAKATQEHRMRLTMALDDPPEEGPGPLALAKASELATKAVELLDALEALRYSAGQADAFHPRFQEGAIPWRLERLEELLKGMAQLLIDSVHVPALNRVTSELPTLSADMEGLGRQLFDVNRRVLALREQTRTLREQAEQVAHAIERAEWSTIDEQRQELMRRKNTAAALILGFLIVGLVVVGGMAFAVLRSISQVVGQLLQASRQLRRGDLAARVPVTGGDELQELGASFNTMAQYLQSRRMRQDNYNEIVTVLNSSLGMDTIVRASLSEVIERTGSTLGALYLKDNVEPVLQLRGTYAMSGEALHRKTVRVGEGIVGQVARTRKLAVVEPVPLEVFGLDVGGGRPGVLRSLLVLPMIHLEELLGVVLLGSMRGYNEEDVRFIEEVVFQVAVSINNARFYQTIEATATALREN